MWKKKKYQKENDKEPIYSMEKFYNMCQKFFDNGLVTPLYETRDYCLCNIANERYIIVADVDQRYGASGFIATIEDAKTIIEKDERFYEFILFLKETDSLHDRLIFLNDRTFDFAVNLKNKTDREGPSKFVDLKFDQYLLSQYKNK